MSKKRKKGKKDAKMAEKVIEYHDRYGTFATVSAYGVSRATIYGWKKKT